LTLLDIVFFAFITLAAGLLLYGVFFWMPKTAERKLRSSAIGSVLRLDTLPGGTGLAIEADRLLVCRPTGRITMLERDQIRGVEVEDRWDDANKRFHPVLHIRRVGDHSEPIISLGLVDFETAAIWHELIDQLRKYSVGAENGGYQSQEFVGTERGQYASLDIYAHIIDIVRAHGGLARDQLATVGRTATTVLVNAFVEYLQEFPTRSLGNIKARQLARRLVIDLDNRDGQTYEESTLEKYIQKAIPQARDQVALERQKNRSNPLK
jgi:hypothetical protein